MPKIKVVKGGDTKPTVVTAPDRYSVWGDQAKDAQGEGWRPAGWDSNGTVTFRNTYNPGANTVAIPGEQSYGHIAAVGYKNGKFDIVLRDANGNVRKEIKKGVSASDVRGYFTSPQSGIAQRVASIQAGTNPDRADAGGGYAAAYNPNAVR